MSKLTAALFANVNTDLAVSVESGDLNNTTQSIEFDVNNSGIKSAQVGDYVALWDKDTYPNPADDANARIGIVTARSKLTVRWGEFGTPIVAYTLRPELAVAFKAGEVKGVVAQLVEDGANPPLVAVTGNITAALNNSGRVHRVTADAVITLPATSVGDTLIFENAGPDGTVQITLDPNASDLIKGNGDAGADGVTVVNTKATARFGDRLVLIGTTAGWSINQQEGIWAVGS
jgi:hypothetical protein